MNRKLCLLFLVAVFALSSMGMSYANDKDVVVWGPVNKWDNEAEKDIGVVIAYPDQYGLVVSVSNAYPAYEAYVTFTIKYIYEEGETDPIYLDVIDITNIYAGTEMDILVTDLNDNPIPPGTILNPDPSADTLDVKLTIIILDGAEQDESYSFGVDFDFSDHLPAMSLDSFDILRK